MRIAEFPLNPMFAKMLLESGGWSLAAPFDSMLVSLNSVHQGRGTNHGLRVAAAVKGLFLPNDETCVFVRRSAVFDTCAVESFSQGN